MLNPLGIGRRLSGIADRELRRYAERRIVKTVDVAGVSAHFRIKTEKELGRLLMMGGEPLTTRFIESLGTGDCFYDIGANTGFYSIVAGLRVGPSGWVVAFEPEPENASQLRANARLNGLNRFVACPVALSDREQLGALRLQSEIAGEGAHALIDQADQQTMYVFLTPLDDVVSRFSLPSPTHVKIDVEGHEESVIAGASKTFGARTLRSVIIEAHYYRQLAQGREYASDTELAAKQRRIVSAMSGHGLRLVKEILTRDGAEQYAHLLFTRG